ncbi:MAG: hypothetical protein K6347_04485 [Campylobacterales bacterium]
MLTFYLETANRLVLDLIEMTRRDIGYVKRAEHEELFKHASAKEEVVDSFERHKALIDAEIAKMAAQRPGASIEELLEPSQREELERLRLSLLELKELNRQLGRMVLAVADFYKTLISRIAPGHEGTGYTQTIPQMRSSLQIRA